MTSEPRASSPRRPARAAPRAHEVGLLATVVTAAAAWFAAGFAAAAPGPAPKPAPAREAPSLVAIESAEDGTSFTFVCRGDFEHRLLQAGDGLQVLVELPGVRNAMQPGALPEPRGLLSGISVGGGADGDEGTRVLLALSRPASAAAEMTGYGLEVHLKPASPPDGGGPVEPGGAAAPAPDAGARSAAGDATEPPEIRAVGPAQPAPPHGGSSRLEAAASALGTPVEDGTRAPLAGVEDRPVGTEDLIEISVFEIPELNRTVRVSERGTISLPLVGEVRASGLTTGRLQDLLRERLGERYVRNPQVSVFVREHGSKKVSVLGAVGKPGVYEMLGPRTLLQVLAQAGGLTEDVGAVLYVIRLEPGGGSDKIPVNVNDLLVSRDPSLNLAIEPGDVVSAPIDRPVYIYVDGAVKTPGRIEQLASRPITLLQAIAKAGGTTERANLKAVQILRQSPDGTQTMVEANLKKIRRGKEPDPILGEGDVVVVPETFF